MRRSGEPVSTGPAARRSSCRGPGRAGTEGSTPSPPSSVASGSVLMLVLWTAVRQAAHSQQYAGGPVCSTVRVDSLGRRWGCPPARQSRCRSNQCRRRTSPLGPSTPHRPPSPPAAGPPPAARLAPQAEGRYIKWLDKRLLLLMCTVRASVLPTPADSAAAAAAADSRAAGCGTKSRSR